MKKFSELAYSRPDRAALEASLRACIEHLKAANDFEQAQKAFLDWHEAVLPALTQNTIASIRNTMDMSDAFYDEEIAFYNRAIPELNPLLRDSIGALLESPFRAEFEKTYGAHLFETLKTEYQMLSDEVIAPSVLENELCTAYSKTVARCSVEFMGEKCNFYGLLRHMQSVDRAERKAAFEAWAKLYEEVSPELEAQYKKLVELRCSIAEKLGFKSFIDYIYPARGRYDYTAAEAAEFREAVHKYITPLCAKLAAERAERLGLEKLSWYDESLVYPEGNAVPQGTPEELVEKAGQMYAALSPETKEFFDFMREHELFDLVTRPNKHLGGYMTELPEYKAPFIFSNFNGTSADVDVLTHEAGHAFQGYYASRRIPLFEQTNSTSEINEIHSMTMELFAYPYMDLFFGENADKYRYAHFCDAVMTIPYLVSVDEFQHRVFENPEAGAKEWRAFWKEIEGKYMPWRSYDGNTFLESGGFWMQKQHIFLYPFYYIDYALAQMGAFALYEKKTRGEDAWGAYLKLCGLGGQYGYFETLERAGIPLPLKEATVKEIAAFAEGQIEKLKEKV